MIVLDTNAVIAIVNRPGSSVRATFEARCAAGETIGVSSIVVFELRFGVAKSRRRRLNADVLDGFLSGPVSTFAFDEIDAAHAGALRATLEASGTPIGPYDVLIAGQALRHGATLVTANAREFAKVRGLKVEDWAAPPEDAHNRRE